MNKLAIVIPAYKADYFEKTLESISKQTNKNFTLYIGDDCSPYDLKSIVERFEDQIDIRYHRFADNLGGKDLVGQWERCIDLTEDEPWLWLFSDDDMMSQDAVESVLNKIEESTWQDLLRLNVDIIDSNDRVLRSVTFPPHISCDEYYVGQLNALYKSYVVEYIFSRKNFMANGRFQKFDLAWGSDAATWLKLSKQRGISTIAHGKVFWRGSGINISTRLDKKLLFRKLRASLNNYAFLYKFSRGRHIYQTTRSLMISILGSTIQLLRASK